MKTLLYLSLIVLGLSFAGAEAPFAPVELKPGVAGLKSAEGAQFDAEKDIWEVKAGPQAVVPIATIYSPGLGRQSYALVGEVRHENVGGVAYLESWTGIGSGKAFSRTLGESGPMGRLHGTSAWREFMLPMNMMGAAGPVTHIEFNANLPDGGTVWVRNLRLVPLPLAVGEMWLRSGVLMAVIAILAAIGALIWLKSRRLAKRRELGRMMAADA